MAERRIGNSVAEAHFEGETQSLTITSEAVLEQYYEHGLSSPSARMNVRSRLIRIATLSIKLSRCPACCVEAFGGLAGTRRIRQYASSD